MNGDGNGMQMIADFWQFTVLGHAWLIILTCTLLLVLIIVRAILRAQAGSGQPDDLVSLAQNLDQTARRMEERIGALETILLERERARHEGVRSE